MFNFFRKKAQDLDYSERFNNTIMVEDFNNIDPIACYFKDETGVTFENQKSILKSKLVSFCKIRHIPGFKQCLEQVKKDLVLKQELINYLTTNESYFYREFHQIEKLVQDIKHIDNTVDILCAPSSTGEEVYSIAIALLEAEVPKTRFNLVGIDINSEVLNHAKSGIYNQRNISKLPLHVLKKYFIEKNSKYHLEGGVKQCVSFETENIFSSSFKTIGRFDYIFSRNMLIYFDDKTKIKAKSILESLLKNHNDKIFFGHADLF